MNDNSQASSGNGKHFCLPEAMNEKRISLDAGVAENSTAPGASASGSACDHPPLLTLPHQ